MHLDDTKTIEQSNKQLEIWQNGHHQQLRAFFQSKLSGQKILIPSDIKNSKELKLLALKKKQCDNCSLRDGYKFICNSEKLHQKNHEYFTLCHSCLINDKLPQTLEKNDYRSMNVFIDELYQLSRHNDKENIHYFEACLRKLQKMTKQFAKNVSTKIEKIGDSLKIQFLNIQQLSKDITLKEDFDDLILREEKCSCSDNCCHCFFKAQSHRNGCSLNELKQKQANFVKNMINIRISADFDGNKKMIQDFFTQFESILANSKSYIENIVVQTTKNVQKLNLSDKNFISNLRSKYQLDKSFDCEVHFRQKTEQSRKKSIDAGVLNHLTHNHLNLFENTRKQLKIDFYPEKETNKLIQKLNQMKSLEFLKIQHKEMGELFLQELEKNGQLISNTHLHQTVKDLEFNFKTNKGRQFIPELLSFENLEKVDLCGNFFQNFHRLNEIMSIQAPLAQRIELLPDRPQQRNIWIGRCDSTQMTKNEEEQLNLYYEILQKYLGDLQGIMLGNIGSPYQKICPKIIKILSKKPPKLKVLILNRIDLQEKVFLDLLNCLPKIEGLFLEDCKNVTKNCHQAINRLPNLKKLGLNRSTNFDFEEAMPKLETFILCHCFEINLDAKLLHFISKSTLLHLNLNGCRFLKEKTLNEVLSTQIRNGAQCLNVNLGGTAITTKSLHILNKCHNLAFLDVGGTNINLNQLLYDLKRGSLLNLRAIQRLSMKNMKRLSNIFQNKTIDTTDISESTNNVFRNILKHFPLLSHLDISNNQTLNEQSIPSGFETLIYLTVKNTCFSVGLSKADSHSSRNCPFGAKNIISSNLTVHQDESILRENQAYLSLLRKTNKYLKIIY